MVHSGEIASAGWTRPAPSVRKFTRRACARDRYLRRRITATLRDSIEEAVLRGEQRQLEAARDAQLGEYPGEVVLHGLFADEKSLGYLAVRQPCAYHRHDLELAAGQAKETGRRCILGHHLAEGV